MAMPNPSGLIRRQTEAVSSQFEGKKNEIMNQIQSKVAEQIAQVKGQEESQLASLEDKIAELEAALSGIPEGHPQKADIIRNIGLLREQRKQVKAQVRLAIASIRANAARERENIKTRLEREKSKAITSAVGAALAQFNAIMQQRKMKQGAVADEVKSGNRG